jgi:hypothetical protein
LLHKWRLEEKRRICTKYFSLSTPEGCIPRAIGRRISRRSSPSRHNVAGTNVELEGRLVCLLLFPTMVGLGEPVGGCPFEGDRYTALSLDPSPQIGNARFEERPCGLNCLGSLVWESCKIHVNKQVN